MRIHTHICIYVCPCIWIYVFMCTTCTLSFESRTLRKQIYICYPVSFLGICICIHAWCIYTYIDMNIRFHVYSVYALFRMKHAKEAKYTCCPCVFLWYLHMYICIVHLDIYTYEKKYSCTHVHFPSNQGHQIEPLSLCLWCMLTYIFIYIHVYIYAYPYTYILMNTCTLSFDSRTSRSRNRSRVPVSVVFCICIC